MSYRVLGDSILHAGGFLTLRAVQLRALLDGGRETAAGTYEFVDRPFGLDAVVLAVWTRAAEGVRVLLRDSIRIPLVFGRGGDPVPRPIAEVIAGIIETGEAGDAAIRKRAAAEAHEEAGLTISADSIRPLGPPMFPTPGMCPELFYFMECEITAAQAAAAVHPPGDGSPFEEGASVRWVPLDDALAACARGELQDMKTEIALRRLADRVRKAKGEGEEGSR